jgi:hypothetical protein
LSGKCAAPCAIQSMTALVASRLPAVWFMTYPLLRRRCCAPFAVALVFAEIRYMGKHLRRTVQMHRPKPHFDSRDSAKFGMVNNAY